MHTIKIALIIKYSQTKFESHHHLVLSENKHERIKMLDKTEVYFFP